MATKTFKIGEYAKGGIIQAIATSEKITIIGKEWDFSTGSRRSSNQDNAKEFTRFECHPKDENVKIKLQVVLTDLTTAYYADMIVKWIDDKLKLRGIHVN
jgi:hypothetical protein